LQKFEQKNSTISAPTLPPAPGSLLTNGSAIPIQEVALIQGSPPVRELSTTNDSVPIEEDDQDTKPYLPRLIRVSGNNKDELNATLVPVSFSSLNSRDVFILDVGETIYQWNSKGASIFEKTKAAAIVRAIDDEHSKSGSTEVIVFEQGNTDPDMIFFWEKLGGEPGDISDDDSYPSSPPRIIKVSDSTGELNFQTIHEGYPLNSKMLDSNDVMVIDVGFQIFVWEGKGSNLAEKKWAPKAAKEYFLQLKDSRPTNIRLHRCIEGSEDEIMKHFISS